MDVGTLARSARAALAAGDDGILEVDRSYAPRREVSALLYDDEGLPTFVCDAGCPVTRAAADEGAALLTVSLARRCRTRFAGRLAIAATVDVSGSTVCLVVLRLTAVWVMDGGGGTSRYIPLPVYFEPASAS